MNFIVKIEPPYKQREIVLCKMCQRYGRTQKYCNRIHNCDKCSEPHPTPQCNKLAETPAKCVHSDGNRSAIYRWCPVYKKLYNKRFSKPKTSDTTTHPRNAHSYTTPSTLHTQAIRKNQSNETIHGSTL